ncbi:MAG TPA: redoxin domain-containing protein [Gemmatimonadaceae bacterium]|nr:redoxin domain-containing protein [Gemmatimonadaceae bacterium]
MNWKRASIALAAATPVIALFAYGFTRDPATIPSPLPGHQAPPFTLAVIASGEGKLPRSPGDTIRLRDLKGKVVVLNFFASWCLPCREEHAALSEAARYYEDKPTQFIGVLYNDEPAAGIQWIEEMGGMKYPAVTDVESRTAIDYGLYGVPETFIIDPTGKVAHKELGPITGPVLRRVIDSVLVSLGQ